MSNKFKLEGLDEVIDALKYIEKLPQKCVTKSAKAGATIALHDARANAPVGESGALKKGIVLKAEKSKVKGKKVYQVTFSSNPVFVKMSKDGKKRYFYPASMEYGYITKSGKKVPGKHFLRNALEKNKNVIESTMVNTLASEIDKLK